MEPECRRISCGEPLPIEGGKVVGSGFEFEDTLEYSCAAGMRLFGVAERTCQSDGSWSGEKPECVREFTFLIFLVIFFVGNQIIKILQSGQNRRN